MLTFAGSGRAGAADGPGRAAEFENPTSIAVGPAGELFIVDQGSGVREIDTEGNVSTLPVKIKKPLGVALLRRSGLVVSGEDGLAVFNIKDQSSVRFPITDESGPSLEHLEGMRPIGQPDALAAIDSESLFYTDSSNSAIYYIDVPFHIGRVVASEPRLLVSPTAVAVRNEHSVAVSTARLGVLFLDHLDTRKPFSPVYAVLPPEITSSSGKYLAAYVGNSFAWWNTDWPDSIEGYLEDGLAGKRGAQGLAVHPSLLPVVMMDSKLASAEDYIKTLGSIGAIKLAILQVNAAFIGSSFSLPDRSVAASKQIWDAKVIAGISDLRQVLEKQKIPLLVVVHPEIFELLSHDMTIENTLVPALLQKGVHVLDLYPQFARAARPTDLYALPDFHFSRAGRRVAAENVMRYMNCFLTNTNGNRSHQMPRLVWNSAPRCGPLMSPLAVVTTKSVASQPWSYHNLPPGYAWVASKDTQSGDVVYYGKAPSHPQPPLSAGDSVYVGPDSIFYYLKHAPPITSSDLANKWLPRPKR
ncbi:MAG: hypothetical protein JOZ22_15525 [Acidobacteriia bacterium]|nr:hypothetical protein [Terriglobia bacterium]